MNIYNETKCWEDFENLIDNLNYETELVSLNRKNILWDLFLDHLLDLDESVIYEIVLNDPSKYTKYIQSIEKYITKYKQRSLIDILIFKLADKSDTLKCSENEIQNNKIFVIEYGKQYMINILENIKNDIELDSILIHKIHDTLIECSFETLKKQMIPDEFFEYEDDIVVVINMIEIYVDEIIKKCFTSNII
jgi:hypothetical protein